MNGKTCGGKGFPDCDDTLVRNEYGDGDIYDDNKDDGNMIHMVFEVRASIAEREGRVGRGLDAKYVKSKAAVTQLV